MIINAFLFSAKNNVFQWLLFANCTLFSKTGFSKTWAVRKLAVFVFYKCTETHCHASSRQISSEQYWKGVWQVQLEKNTRNQQTCRRFTPETQVSEGSAWLSFLVCCLQGRVVILSFLGILQILRQTKPMSFTVCSLLTCGESWSVLYLYTIEFYLPFYTMFNVISHLLLRFFQRVCILPLDACHSLDTRNVWLLLVLMSVCSCKLSSIASVRIFTWCSFMALRECTNHFLWPHSVCRVLMFISALCWCCFPFSSKRKREGRGKVDLHSEKFCSFQMESMQTISESQTVTFHICEPMHGRSQYFRSLCREIFLVSCLGCLNGLSQVGETETKKSFWLDHSNFFKSYLFGLGTKQTSELPFRLQKRVPFGHAFAGGNLWCVFIHLLILEENYKGLCSRFHISSSKQTFRRQRKNVNKLHKFSGWIVVCLGFCKRFFFLFLFCLFPCVLLFICVLHTETISFLFTFQSDCRAVSFSVVLFLVNLEKCLTFLWRTLSTSFSCE